MRRRLLAYLPLLLCPAVLLAGAGSARADVLSPAVAPGEARGRAGGLSGFDTWLPYTTEFPEVTEYLRALGRKQGNSLVASVASTATTALEQDLPSGLLGRKETIRHAGTAPPGMTGEPVERGNGPPQDGSLSRHESRREDGATYFMLDGKESPPPRRCSRLFRPPRPAACAS